MKDEEVKKKLYQIQQQLLRGETQHMKCICGSLLMSMILPTQRTDSIITAGVAAPPNWLAFQCGNPACKQAYVVFPDDGVLQIVTGG